MHGSSAPPPSPIPPPPSEPGKHADSLSALAGWHPADNDDSPRAVAWRARTALRRADRSLAAIHDLSKSLETLTKTITSWSDTWGARWSTTGRVARWVLAIVGGPALLGLARAVYLWLSTLHH